MVKFGKQIKKLADKSQYDHCVAYDVLKKAINLVVAADKDPRSEANLQSMKDALGPSAGIAGMGRPPDSRFHCLLQHELAKVNTYAKLQVTTFMEDLRGALKIAAQPAPLQEETLAELERALDAISEKLVSMEHFRRLNFTAFRKIVKKFDKQSADAGIGTLGAWFLPTLLREPFVAESLDPLVLALAWGFAALRRHRNRGGVKHSQPPPLPPQPLPSTPFPSPGVAVSTAMRPGHDSLQPSKTYWLAPTGRMRALCILIKRFDITLAPGATEVRLAQPSSLEDYIEQLRRMLAYMTPEALARSSTWTKADNLVTYYDDDDFAQYMARLNGEGPRGSRRRLTVASGQAAGEAPGAGLTEPDGSGFALHLDAFINSSCTVSQSPVEGRPVVTVESKRLLLRGDTPGTHGTYIALDEDVHMSLVGDSGQRDSQRMMDFPYCLLEVAVEEDVATDTWIEELTTSAALRTVSGFHMGAHAIAKFLGDKVPKMPQWYQHLESMEMAAPPEAWGLQQEWSQAVAEENSAADKTQADAQIRMAGLESVAAEDAGQQERTIEPKNMLASERTMLEWMHTVLALAFVGIGLWKHSLSLSSGFQPRQPIALGLLNAVSWSSLTLGIYSLVLVAISITFAWYAAIMHVRRLKALAKESLSERVFNARPGPLFFAALVGFALVSHLLVNIIPTWWLLGADFDPGAVIANSSAPGAVIVNNTDR